MRRLGAHCLVVAMKRGNARGAKGVGHQRWIGSTGVGSTGSGRNLIINGRRQPSHGGTSRMMREYHVRICEGLGVQLPGSTRQSRLGRGKLQIQQRPKCPVSDGRPKKAACRDRPKAATGPIHLITLSARSRNASAIRRSSAFAVLRLIANSNLLGCSTGMFAGFAIEV